MEANLFPSDTNILCTYVNINNDVNSTISVNYLSYPIEPLITAVKMRKKNFKIAIISFRNE